MFFKTKIGNVVFQLAANIFNFRMKNESLIVLSLLEKNKISNFFTRLDYNNRILARSDRGWPYLTILKYHC